jgi:hypothetical protein
MSDDEFDAMFLSAGPLVYALVIVLMLALVIWLPMVIWWLWAS